MTNRIGFSLAGLCVSLLASVAFASDGVIEINQVCATETGCLPGDAPGFPVSLQSRTSYILTSSLQTTGDVAALTGSGSSISVDLNGFTISGDYVCSTAPPNCLSRASHAAIEAPSSSVSLRNGTIRAWPGRVISVGFNSEIEGLLVERSGGDGIVARAGSIIRGNRITNLYGSGIRVYFDDDVDGEALVEGNIIRGVRGDAIRTMGGVVTENYTANVFGSPGAFGNATAYGLNRFATSPTGGTSLGNNVCGLSVC